MANPNERHQNAMNETGNDVVSFREMVLALAEPMSMLANDSFSGYVEIDEVPSDAVFVVRCMNEEDVCTATLSIRQGPICEGRQMIWGRPGDVDEDQLLPLIPRALLGILAY